MLDENIANRDVLLILLVQEEHNLMPVLICGKLSHLPSVVVLHLVKETNNFALVSTNVGENQQILWTLFSLKAKAARSS